MVRQLWWYHFTVRSSYVRGYRVELTSAALERLHLLKKDISQLGQNARKAVKFLDQVTSTPNLSHDPVIIQGPDDQYPKWSDVESRYVESVIQREELELNVAGEYKEPVHTSVEQAEPEKLIQDLSLSSEDIKTSPVSTPPLSPSASDPQSTKTSPETQYATMTKHEATPVPPTLRDLINFVVWYTYESHDKNQPKRSIFLTNSADAAQIAKDFGVKPKTIHQLRASIGSEQPTKKDQSGSKKKKGARSMSFKQDTEPKTLFRYDEASSEDEELVFQPRSRDPPRPGSSGRGGSNSNANSFRGRGTMHSPSNSISASTLPKPQVPVEEIDPDSFDRGTFARGSTPLANVGLSYGPANNNIGRGGQRHSNGPNQRGGFRGNGFRGRGRGRLFVP